LPRQKRNMANFDQEILSDLTRSRGRVYTQELNPGIPANLSLPGANSNTGR
jgi:hypothetical protein